MAVANNSQVRATGVVHTDNVVGSTNETVGKNVTGVVPNPALRTKSLNVATRTFLVNGEDGNDYTLSRANKTVQIRN
jgi:hypothetical protein